MNYMEKIQLKKRGESEIVNVQDILRVEADGNYSILHIGKDTKRASKQIGYFEEQLSGMNFIRIHNSHIVNKNHIKSFTSGKKMILHLSDGTELPVSESYRESLQKRLSEEYKMV